MTREIKFRVWDTETKEFIEYWLGNSNETLNELFEDERYVFTEYTGLKDKNGKEIYEGDVLKFTEVDEDSAFGAEETYITEVKWISELAQWRVVSPSGRRIELHCVLQRPCFYNQEIIGKVYENPDLLK